MIRLAVRCRPDQADLVLAELLVLAPNGVEEEPGHDYVEYAIYGGEGELPELGELRVAAGEGLVDVVATEVPDDWADRWRDFHRPIWIGDRLCIRPSWERSERRAEGAAQVRAGVAAVDVVVDPGHAFGTGAHPTTRLSLELLLELAEAGEARGPLTDLGTGSGVLAIAAVKLGWGPVHAYDHEPSALDAAAANARANDVEIRFDRADLRRSLPKLAPTTLANVTAPVHREVARQVPGDEGGGGGGSRSLPAVAPRAPAPSPQTLIASGLLPSELDDVSAAYARAGLAESERRREGDWAALLLRRV